MRKINSRESKETVSRQLLFPIIPDNMTSNRLIHQSQPVNDSIITSRHTHSRWSMTDDRRTPRIGFPSVSRRDSAAYENRFCCCRVFLSVASVGRFTPEPRWGHVSSLQPDLVLLQKCGEWQANRGRWTEASESSGERETGRWSAGDSRETRRLHPARREAPGGRDTRRRGRAVRLGVWTAVRPRREDATVLLLIWKKELRCYVTSIRTWFHTERGENSYQPVWRI